MKLWRDNGGALSQPMTVAAANPNLPDNDGEADESEVPLLPRHRVLEPGYILKSKAFMLTFNSDTFTRDTWKSFENWVKRKRKELGARAWAAM